MIVPVLLGIYIGGYVVAVRRIYPVLCDGLPGHLDDTDKAMCGGLSVLTAFIWPIILLGKFLVRGL